MRPEGTGHAESLLLIFQTTELQAIAGGIGEIRPLCFSVIRINNDKQANHRADLRVMHLSDEREVAAGVRCRRARPARRRA
jgi:hypothetical protein